METLEQIFPYFFAVFFPFWWLFITSIINSMAGFPELAADYSCPGKFTGEIHSLQSGRMNKVRYSGALQIGVSDQGLYLRPIFIFGFFTEPVLIPWDHLEAEAATVFLRNMVHLRLTSNPDQTFTFFQHTYSMMEPYLGPIPKERD